LSVHEGYLLLLPLLLFNLFSEELASLFFDFLGFLLLDILQCILVLFIVRLYFIDVFEVFEWLLVVWGSTYFLTLKADVKLV
jgi:hypothetical protein